MDSEIKELLTKQNIMTILFAIVAFIGLVVVVGNKYRADGRIAALDMLRVEYYTWPIDMQYEREQIMQKYGFTDDDINPDRLLGLEKSQ